MNRYPTTFNSLALLVLLTATSALASPKVECEIPKFDFGTQLVGEPITNRFVLWNRGDEPLEILEIKNCCGVSSSIEPMIVEPGTNTVCTSIFQTKNRKGIQEKQILLVTNDKRQPYYDLRMTGTLKRPIDYSPHFVRLKDVLSDTDFSATITATNLLNERVTLDSVDVTISELRAKVIVSKEHNWEVELHSNGPLPEGQVNGRLRLHFSTGMLEVPVVGTVDSILKATPDKIEFSSETDGPISRLVMLRSSDQRSFDVESAELRGAEGDVTFKELAKGKWQLSLSLNPESVPSDAVLMIKTSINSQKMISVPLLLK